MPRKPQRDQVAFLAKARTNRHQTEINVNRADSSAIIPSDSPVASEVLHVASKTHAQGVPPESPVVSLGTSIASENDVHAVSPESPHHTDKRDQADKRHQPLSGRKMNELNCDYIYA